MELNGVYQIMSQCALKWEQKLDECSKILCSKINLKNVIQDLVVPISEPNGGVNDSFRIWRRWSCSAALEKC